MKLLRSLPAVAPSFAGGTLSKGHVDVMMANVNDEDGTEPPDDETNHVHFSELPDGKHKLDGILAGDNAVIVKNAMAHCMPDVVEGEPPRSFAQRQAEALVEMARRAMQNTNTTVRRSTKALLLIPFDSYANGGVAAHADGTIVPPDHVRRLLCDAVIEPLAQGEHGQPLWMGREVRTPPPTRNAKPSSHATAVVRSTAANDPPSGPKPTTSTGGTAIRAKPTSTPCACCAHIITSSDPSRRQADGGRRLACGS